MSMFCCGLGVDAMDAVPGYYSGHITTKGHRGRILYRAHDGTTVRYLGESLKQLKPKMPTRGSRIAEFGGFRYYATPNPGSLLEVSPTERGAPLPVGKLFLATTTNTEYQAGKSRFLKKNGFTYFWSFRNLGTGNMVHLWLRDDTMSKGQKRVAKK